MDDVRMQESSNDADQSDSSMGDVLSPNTEKNYKFMTIDDLQELSKTEGLPHINIMSVISSIESDEYPNTEKMDLMKCLIPSSTIHEEAFVRMSCLLSSFKFSMQVKVEILKWMIAVYEYVESLVMMRLLYELFLQLLNQDLLRPYVCHFLYLLTDKSCVTGQRLCYLEKLIKKYGNEDCLVFLRLYFYKQSPDCFVEDIKIRLEYRFCPLGVYPDLIKGVHPSHNPNTSIGYISTFEANCSDTYVSGVPSEGDTSYKSYINSQFCEICQEFKALNKSTNVSKILKSKYRRLYLTADIPVKIKTKIYDYILTSLYSDENFKSQEFLIDILEIFHDMQASMVLVSDFTEMLISSWDGESDLDIYTALLQYQPICCFQDIIYKLDLIREHLFKASVHTKCRLLYCFSKMYENWVLLQHDRFPSIRCNNSCYTSMADDYSISLCMTHLPKDEIIKLGSYIDSICNTLIIDDTTNPCLLNEILLHYERMCTIHMKMASVCSFRIPTKHIFCSSLFSSSSITLENLCRLILRYNNETLQMLYNEHEDAKFSRMHFKFCLNDIHNFLFDGQQKYTYLSKMKVLSTLRELYPGFEGLLSLLRHPALLMKKLLFLRENPEERSEDNCIDRSSFLQYLADNDLPSFRNLKSIVNP